MSFPPPTQTQARLIWLAAAGLAIAVLVALVAAVIWGLGRVVEILSPVLWPIAVAGVIAYLLDPVVDFLDRKGTPRTRAIVIVFGVALVTVGAFFGSIVPQLITETQQFASRVPEYTTRAEKRIEHWINDKQSWLQRFLPHKPVPPPVSEKLPDENAVALQTNVTANPSQPGTNAPPILIGLLDKETLQTAAGGLAGILRKGGSWLFGRIASWFGIMAGLALVPVYAFYFLLENERISTRWTDYLPLADSSFKQELVFVLSSINNYLIAFFRGQVLVAICDGVLYGIGFLIIGLPYAILLGVAAMLLTIIPFLGAIIIFASALVIALVQFGDWLHPLLVLAVFAFVQTLEGLVISPKIMGGRVGLHPVTIIIAVMVGTTLLGGLLGGILAIPLTAVLRVLMFRYVWKRPSKV